MKIITIKDACMECGTTKTEDEVREVQAGLLVCIICEGGGR